MNYLELVTKAMRKAKVRTGDPDTLVGAVDVVADFKDYVADSWRELQQETPNWWFRQKLAQSFALVSGTSNYSMPTGLLTLNYRTCSLRASGDTGDSDITFLRYEAWRRKSMVDTADARPLYITEKPDETLEFWPAPDAAYTFKFDGVWDIDEMSADSDEPGTTITGGTVLLPERYQWILIYDAARRHFASHENQEGVAEMQTLFRSQRDRLSEKQTPPVYVKPGVLTGLPTTAGRRLR